VIKGTHSKGFVAKSMVLPAWDRKSDFQNAMLMKKRIAVEGLKKEIVSLVCQMLERLSYEISYRHESDFKKTDDYVFDLLNEPGDIVRNIIDSQPNLTLICNARCYFPSFLEYYAKSTDIPVLVLTGGGPELIEKVREYTPHILEIPFKMEDLYRTIEKILQ
jgi:hypothetical protein